MAAVRRSVGDHGCPTLFRLDGYPDMNGTHARSDDRMVRPAALPYSFLGQMNRQMTDTGTWRKGHTMIVGASLLTSYVP
jgi:hypothetical protein